jgi:ubiquinone/menaquinone biosynthesis C-methylase UbiE
MSAILLSLGADVTGLDLAEPMIARARSKLLERKPHVRFFQGDAENTLEPDGSKDAVVCRHLVWTLIDPAAAFRDWYRVLRPGGRVAIIDGDWVQLPFRGRVQRRLAGLVDRFSGSVDVHHGHDPRHETILSQVYFRNGLKLEDAVRLLTDQGFHSPRLAPLNAVEAGQRSGSQTLGEWLRIGGYRRFALSMEK